MDKNDTSNLKGSFMVDQDFKKKIINTINRYETKCQGLQSEIDVLKTTIDQLSTLPQGMYDELDTQLKALRTEVHEHKGSVAINHRLHLLNDMMQSMEKKKQNSRAQLKRLCRQSLSVLDRLDLNKEYQQKFFKLQALLDDEDVSEKLLVNNYLKQLDSFIFHVAANLSPKLGDLDEKSDLDITESSPAIPEIASLPLAINDSLRELLQNLALPEAFAQRTDQLNNLFAKPISTKQLVSIIDTISELVIQAFHLEQNRFKGFLNELSHQLETFDKFLSAQADLNEATVEKSSELQKGISEDISAIKQEMSGHKNVEDMTLAIHNHLNKIGKKIENFRDSEAKRMSDYEKEINSLKKQLVTAHENSDELRKLISFHEELMNRDCLTGLPNRAAYEEHLKGAFHRWQRGFGQLVIAIGDLDHFKLVNDTYGHLAGDKVLKKTSELMKSSLRAVDFVARYGGEEFVIVFERTPIEDAHKRLDKLRQDLDELEFSYRKQPVEVTISFGLASIVEEDDLESVFARADKALYEAKKNGRNQVCSL
ncbi:diguanylate cyclase [Legionella sp. W05-934-2]|uniref:diguanylate cyclase n=1 Tax=Legionella sp. W05-934-2 TaxID=1198649 RepID=UPI0034626B70